MKDEKIMKVGANIGNDFRKLARDFELDGVGHVDLGKIANERLGIVRRWSLDDLSQRFVGSF